MLMVDKEKEVEDDLRKKEAAAAEKMDAYVASINEAVSVLSKAKFYDPEQTKTLVRMLSGVVDGMKGIGKPLDLSPFLDMMSEIKRQNQSILELIQKLPQPAAPDNSAMVKVLQQLAARKEAPAQALPDFGALIEKMQPVKSEPTEWKFKIHKNPMDGSTEIIAIPIKK